MIPESEILFRFERCTRLLHNQKFICALEGNDARIYDRNGTLLHTFQDLKCAANVAFVTDTLLMLKNTTGQYALFDLEKMTCVRKIKSLRPRVITLDAFVLTPDHKAFVDLVDVEPGFFLQDLQTGKVQAFPMDGIFLARIFCDEEKKIFYFLEDLSDEKELFDWNLYAWEYPFKNTSFYKIETIPLPEMCRSLEAEYRNGKILCRNSSKILLFDLQKHNLEFLYATAEDQVILQTRWSDNGNFVAILENGKEPEFNEFTVYDVNTHACIQRGLERFLYDIDFWDRDTKLLLDMDEATVCVRLQ